MFGVFLHAHLAGTGLRQRIVRNGVELPPLMDNPHYDASYQAFTGGGLGRSGRRL